MGNCGSNPKTNEGYEAPLPSAAEDVKVVQQDNSVETKTEETPVPVSDDNSLVNLLSEKVEKEEEKKEEQAKEKAKSEEVKAEAKKEKKSLTEEAKPETKEEKPLA